jgi:hypothetical protein
LKNSNQIIPWWQVNFGPEAAAAAALEISSGRLSMGKTTRLIDGISCFWH